MAKWNSDVKLALRFENNKTCDIGTYTLTQNGTPLYSSAVKHDDAYSYYKDGNGTTNALILPDALGDNIGAEDFWTIEWWGYHDGTKRYAFYFNKGTIGTPIGFFWIYSDATINQLIWRWNGFQYSMAFSDFNEWNHFAFTWSNPTSTTTGTLKLYINNSLVWTLTSAPKSFASNNNNIYIGAEPTFNLATFNYIDNFIVSFKTLTSFPTLPLPDADTAKRIYTCRNINGGGEYKRIATKHNIAGGF